MSAGRENALTASPRRRVRAVVGGGGENANLYLSPAPMTVSSYP